MSEYIEVGQPLQFTDPNTPTRVGEIVENVSDIYNIPSPRLGMQVFVKSEKKNFVITALKSKNVNGVDVPEAAVEAFEPVGAKAITWVNEGNPSDMNDFVVAGVYDIKGERKRENDNLPILNTGGGHTFNARLEVLDSSINDTTNSDDKCITQKLTLSNRVGGDGNVYIRTGRGRTYDSITWEKWGTLQTNINIGQVASLDEFVDNGIYSGVWTDGSSFAQTFVMVVINDYAIAGDNKTIVQYKYAYDTLKGNGEPTYNTRSLHNSVWSDWEDVHDDDLNVLKSELLNAIKEETLRAKNEEFRIDYKSEDIIESIGARIISKKHIIHREVGKSYTKLVYIGNLPAQQYKSRFFLYDLINDDVTINLCNKNGDVVINLGTIISDTADIEATFNIENSFDAWLSVNLPISQKDYSVDLYCTLIPKNTILDIINDEITRAKNAESLNSIAIGEEEYRAIKAETRLQKNIDNTNNIVGIEEKGKLTVYIGAVMEDGSTYSTNNSAYTNAFKGGDIAITNDGYFIYDARKVSADGVAEMVAVNSKRLRTEKGYTYQLNISKDNNAQFSNDELDGIVGLYNYDSSEIEKNKTDIQYLFEEAVKFDSFEVEELGDGIGINYNTIDGNSGSSIEIPFATTETAGVMSAEDKKALDDVPKNIAKEKTAIVNGDTIAGLAREVYSRTGKVDTATFLKRTTAGGTTISDGVASIKEIGGNIVKNLVDGTFESGWDNTNYNLSIHNSVIVAKKKNIAAYLDVKPIGMFSSIANHIIYSRACVKSTLEKVSLSIAGQAYTNLGYSSSAYNWTSLSVYGTITQSVIDNNRNYTSIRATNLNNTVTYDDYLLVKNYIVINLTEMFGAGKEPSKEECDRLFGNMDALPQGLTIAQPTGLKSVGYNQWNPVNVLRNKSIVENAIEDDVENSHIAVVECLPCKIGEGENNGYVVGYGEGEQWDEDGIEVYFSPLNPMDYIDQDVDLYMHKLEQDATYGTYVPQCKGYLLVVTPTTDKLCVNFHWSGDRSKLDYEEYTESNVALPEIPQMSKWGLAGIQTGDKPIIDNINLDTMTYIKKIGCVDMGTLSWVSYGDKTLNMYRALVEGMSNVNIVAMRTTGILNNKYPVDKIVAIDKSFTDKTCKRNGTHIFIRDTSYTDASSLKASLQGVMLYYELAEPEEYPIVTKASPNYIGSDYGVEEFTGSKVPLNANILFYMRSLVGETRNFLDRLYDNTDKTDAKEVADYITNGIEGNKELATNAPNLALRALYIAAGAEYNDTGKLIIKDTPWKNDIDSAEYKSQWNLDVLSGTVDTVTYGGKTYEFLVDTDGTWKIITRVGDKMIWDDTKVIHRPGYYYLNGLGDITEEQMMDIYNAGTLKNNITGFYSLNKNIRTFLPSKTSGQEGHGGAELRGILNNATSVESAVFTNRYSSAEMYGCAFTITGGSIYASFFNCTNLKYIQKMSFATITSIYQNSAFDNCKSLVYVKINKLICNLRWANSSMISKGSVLYTIQNASPTKAITITLHPDAYTRIANQPDILEALEAQPLVTLVSA